MWHHKTMRVDIVLSDFLFLSGVPSQSMMIREDHFGTGTDGIVFSEASGCFDYPCRQLNDNGWKSLGIISKLRNGLIQKTYIALENCAADELLRKWEEEKKSNNGVIAVDCAIDMDEAQVKKMLEGTIFNNDFSGRLGSNLILNVDES